jgi:hypothetical protein
MPSNQCRLPLDYYITIQMLFPMNSSHLSVVFDRRLVFRTCYVVMRYLRPFP